MSGDDFLIDTHYNKGLGRLVNNGYDPLERIKSEENIMQDFFHSFVKTCPNCKSPVSVMMLKRYDDLTGSHFENFDVKELTVSFGAKPFPEGQDKYYGMLLDMVCYTCHANILQVWDTDNETLIGQLIVKNREHYHRKSKAMLGTLTELKNELDTVNGQLGDDEIPTYWIKNWKEKRNALENRISRLERRFA